MNKSLLLSAFKATAPVFFGYIPMGIAFGVLFNELGFHWIYATLMALVIYAGAAQFMAVGLLANHAGFTEVAITTLLLNSRHLFYGISLINKFKTRGLRKFYLIFGLTDETYSLLTGTRPTDDKDQTNFYLLITVLNHSYWVIGSTLGAIVGANISFNTSGLDFTLPALFTVLAIEQYKSVRESWPFVMAFAVAFVSIWLFSRENMLLMSILLSIIVLLLLQRTKKSPEVIHRGSL
ncbi:branched-chain amino acid transporter AzlC [Psychromonas sp. MB-3u-54]|uniref:AzlC family ABC transporter permease n=1 Tax=Psychromonas sp. MB-3u-54 TaxID=2058319 RepID=UPI000C3203ED|nr:AzlC family ABC transporter permease [Psychromonas sp. MB-3u-54]PKH03075.1 branched-chain amino acid transporter AzlC [Psychromonas sp. MB-3u-54]